MKYLVTIIFAACFVVVSCGKIEPQNSNVEDVPRPAKVDGVILVDTRGRELECKIIERREHYIDVLKISDRRKYTIAIENLSDDSKYEISKFPLVSKAIVEKRELLAKAKRNIKIEFFYDQRTDALRDSGGNVVCTYDDLLNKYGYWYGFTNVSSGGGKQKALDLGISKYPCLFIEGKIIQLSRIEGTCCHSGNSFSVFLNIFEENLVKEIDEILLELEEQKS